MKTAPDRSTSRGDTSADAGERRLKTVPDRVMTPAETTVDGEQGQIMVLLIGYVLLSLLLVTVVAAGSSLYIGQKKLLSAADGAALAAADTFRLGSGATGDAPPSALLTQGGVVAAAQAYLSENDTYASFPEVSIDAGTGTPDGRTAQVTLTAVVHPMFINFLVPDGIAVTVTSSARSQLVQ